MRTYKRDFKEKLSNRTMCNVQHIGYPCNTCFHSTLEADNLDLKEDIHEYWLAVLAYRGDYPELPSKPNLIQELYNKL